VGVAHHGYVLDTRHGVCSLEVPVKNRVRELRADRQWSQAELAKRLDVSRQTVNAIETEKYDPSLPLAFRVARLFALRIEDIFADKNGIGSKK
jgi:putative transcriptional regulator